MIEQAFEPEKVCKSLTEALGSSSVRQFRGEVISKGEFEVRFTEGDGDAAVRIRNVPREERTDPNKGYELTSLTVTSGKNSRTFSLTDSSSGAAPEFAEKLANAINSRHIEIVRSANSQGLDVLRNWTKADAVPAHLTDVMVEYNDDGQRIITANLYVESIEALTPKTITIGIGVETQSMTISDGAPVPEAPAAPKTHPHWFAIELSSARGDGHIAAPIKALVSQGEVLGGTESQSPAMMALYSRLIELAEQGEVPAAISLADLRDELTASTELSPKAQAFLEAQAALELEFQRILLEDPPIHRDDVKAGYDLLHVSPAAGAPSLSVEIFTVGEVVNDDREQSSHSVVVESPDGQVVDRATSAIEASNGMRRFESITLGEEFPGTVSFSVGPDLSSRSYARFREGTEYTSPAEFLKANQDPGLGTASIMAGVFRYEQTYDDATKVFMKQITKGKYSVDELPLNDNTLHRSNGENGYAYAERLPNVDPEVDIDLPGLWRATEALMDHARTCVELLKSLDFADVVALGRDPKFHFT